ncbi:MAG: hypothetical protein M5U26_04230 [Planctomycetota bacterium]|nr:hypothetical protein [Planctomycetota bacterium]
MTPSRERLPESLAPAPACWIWPLRPADGVRRRVLAWAGAAEPLVEGWRGPAAGILAGALPALASLALDARGHQELAATLLLPLFLACVRRDDQLRGLGVLGAAFLAHALVVFAWGYANPGSARVLPGAEAYWQKQCAWILSGWDPEYDAGYWIPAHLALAACHVLYTYASLGWLTLQQGFLQTDLMNYYVARLAHGSFDGLVSVGLGWHLWSLLRGAGFLFLTFEVASLSLERLTGAPSPPPPAAPAAGAWGSGFFSPTPWPRPASSPPSGMACTPIWPGRVQPEPSGGVQSARSASFCGHSQRY